jgi:signal transduction histidine kinase
MPKSPKTAAAPSLPKTSWYRRWWPSARVPSAAGSQAEKDQQQVLALINTMDDGVLIIDPDGMIITRNQAAAAFTSQAKARPGQPLKDALALIEPDGTVHKFNIRHPAELVERKDLRLQAPDDSYINVALKLVPYVADHQNRGSILIIKDITRDQTIGQEREEFIAVASHELRTPLTVAEGNISLLLSPPLLPEQPEAVTLLGGALRSLQQLSSIINDLTDLSLADNRQLDVELEPLNPLALLKEFETDYGDQAKAKGLALRLAIDPAANLPSILTSRHIIREILTIFVANALKFTDKGSVTLAVENRADRPQGVTFSVTDTGLGIAQSDQKRIFEKFFQSEHYMTRVHGGTGLGLFIAKKLATRLTGEVWFETELSKGSTFYLWVPPYSHDKDDRHKVASAETKDLFSAV